MIALFDLACPAEVDTDTATEPCGFDGTVEANVRATGPTTGIAAWQCPKCKTENETELD